MKRALLALSRLSNNEKAKKLSRRSEGSKMLTNEDDKPFSILPNPIQSESDNKEYRVIKLKNGLTALLIHQTHEEEENAANDEESTTSSQADEPMEEGSDSDDSGSDGGKDSSETHQSAASLTVGVGSFEDPDDLPGLAHFLEHMVFMGSEKYPQENDFDAFIKKQGGEDNASTDWETTTFYFISQPQSFKDSLDRFAQFFISPLLKKEAMQREREAIESEFNLNLASDYNRKSQLLGSLAKKNHPVTKFAWGNIRSLGGKAGDEQEKRDSEVHARLRQFREKHYLAEAMTLAVQSTHSLDMLQEFVVETFGAVPYGNPPKKTKPEITPDLEAPFNTTEFNKIYYVAPVKDIQEVQLTWSLPSMLNKYKSKPERYASWVIGYEGKGSLIEYLRKKVWALELVAGNEDSGSDHNSYYLHFSLTVSLTEEGYKNIDKVLEAVFGFLHMMHHEGPQERIYKELKSIAETKFRFAPEPSPGDNVESLSEHMHKYPSEHYITGSELLYEYDPEGIRECLSYLQHNNVNVMILTNGHKQTYDLKEPWFNTPYAVQDISPEQLSSWENATVLDAFTLPEPNPYLTSNFTIFEPEDDASEYPIKVVKHSAGELWFKQDKKFNLPRAYIIFHLISPLIFLSPENACMLDMLIGGWKQQLTTKVYPAEVAELSYSITPTESGTGQGISIMVWGYNEKLPLFMETILKEWDGFEESFSKDLFDAVKDVVKKSYYNGALKPSKLHKDIANSVIKSTHWTVIQKYEAIGSISFEQLKLYSKQLKNRLYCRMLIQGNMLKAQAIDTFGLVQKTLNYKPLIANTWPHARMAQIPIGEHFLTVESIDVNNSNSAITQHFFCGLASFREVSIAEMIMLMFGESAFDFLRTKEQLGYSVSTPLSLARGILRFSVSVNNQEDKNSLSHVDEKIQEFLLKFYNDLKVMTSEQLEELRVSAMRQKMQADLQLREEANRNWEEVYTEEFMFDRHKKEHDEIANITHQELLEFFHKYVFDHQFVRTLSVAVKAFVPSSNKTVRDSKCSLKEMCIKYTEPGELKRKVNHIQDIDEFKRSLYLYPAHKVLN
ncbi:Hypothetical predicted protein [Cloeon dipterum]|uniref:Peptidase M16 N-terminal domain-containing protein n=1 Tax=Cloeon dipterum TaxID=197152 RepID=A0A8S1DJ07_9INSE|nr:Hypothetical predicted protein [Cloeon dipterum]